MTKSKVYSMSKLLWIAPLAVTTIFIAYCFQSYSIGSKIFMGLLCLLSWYAFVSIPTRIRIEGDSLAIFESVLTTTLVRIHEITLIERNGKTTTIRHTSGKIQVSNLIPNIDEFFQDLKRLNPSIADDLSPIAKFAQSPVRVAGLVFALAALAAAIAALAINIPAVGRFFR